MNDGIDFQEKRDILENQIKSERFLVATYKGKAVNVKSDFYVAVALIVTCVIFPFLRLGSGHIHIMSVTIRTSYFWIFGYVALVGYTERKVRKYFPIYFNCRKYEKGLPGGEESVFGQLAIHERKLKYLERELEELNEEFNNTLL